MSILALISPDIDESLENRTGRVPRSQRRYGRISTDRSKTVPEGFLDAIVDMGEYRRIARKRHRQDSLIPGSISVDIDESLENRIGGSLDSHRRYRGISTVGSRNGSEGFLDPFVDIGGYRRWGSGTASKAFPDPFADIRGYRRCVREPHRKHLAILLSISRDIDDAFDSRIGRIPRSFRRYGRSRRAGSRTRARGCPVMAC